MFNLNAKKIFLLSLVASSFLFVGCDVTQEQPGEAPDVDVQVDEGELPEYDVETPDVEVGTEEEEVTVPDVDVELPQDEEN